MKMPKSKFFRTFLYFVVVGGLLTISSFVIKFLWNILIASKYGEISFLEAIGINAILYLFVYSIGYGYFGAQTNLKFGTFYDLHLKDLSQKEKEELKLALEKKIAD